MRPALMLTLVLALALISTTSASGAPVDEPQSPRAGDQLFRPGDQRLHPDGAADRLIVRAQPGMSARALRALHEKVGAEVVRPIPGIDATVVRVADPEAALAAYQSHPGIAWVERDGVISIPAHEVPEHGVGRLAGGGARRDARTVPAAPASPLVTPNDPRFVDQWHHDTIGSERAWDETLATDVVIAIVDTGVQCDHPDLRGACVAGYDFINDDDDPRDDNRHGTIEAGLAAAVTNNRVGVAGVAWDARIMPLKAANADGRADFAAVTSAITWAADNGADVINLSWGGPEPSAGIRDAVRYAYAKGVTLVASSGNHGTDMPIYPAAIPEVIAVGATDTDDSRMSFSAYGPHLELTAPGTYMVSTDLGGGYALVQGTSEAAPLVSGLAALLIARNSDYDNERVRAHMAATVVDLGDPGRDDYFGWGRIDAARALTSHFDWPTPTAAATATPTATPTSPATATLEPTETPTNAPTPTASPTPPAAVPAYVPVAWKGASS